MKLLSTTLFFCIFFLFSKVEGSNLRKSNNPVTAFGNLNTDFGYFGAPYTGARPFQNTGFLRADRQFGLGFDADIYNPSFGGSSNPRGGH